jgi:hypothetical protein
LLCANCHRLTHALRLPWHLSGTPIRGYARMWSCRECGEMLTEPILICGYCDPSVDLQLSEAVA